MKIKRGTIKIILCFVICLGILATATFIFGGNDVSNADLPLTAKSKNKLSFDFTEATSDVLNVKNNSYSLTIDKSNDLLTLTDITSGSEWKSVVVDGLQDENAEGIAKTDLLSQLIVTYKSPMMTEMATNSYMDCVMNKTVSYYVAENAIKAVYKFEKLGFTIPVIFIISEDGFDTVIDVKNITEGDNSILSISLLPYFGAAGVKDEGYMVVPDGSGAIINFNNRKYNAGNYQKPFYGGDKSVVLKESNQEEKNLFLPVFGEKKNKDAFLAIVEEGASCGRLNAYVSGDRNSYNNIYSTFIYRTSNSIDVKDNASSTKSVLFSAIDSANIEYYYTKYRFLSGVEADYVGMAKLTSEYLKSCGLLKKADGNPYLNLEFYGATQKPASFLGFRHTKTQALTTIDDVKEILSKTYGYCDNLHIVLKNFSKNEIEKKPMTGYSFVSSVGSKKELEQLKNEFKNIQISAAYDFLTLTSGGNGYSKHNDVVLGLDLSTIKLYPYKINTASVDETQDPVYLIASDKYGRAKQDIIESIKDNNFSYAYFEKAGNTVYSDFGRGGCQAAVTAEQIANVLSAVGEDSNVVLNAPNMYALPYASSLTGIPSVSSSWQIFDYDIPFYQIAVRGLLDYSGEVLNFKGYTIRELLKNIECGANLSYAVTACEAKELLYSNNEELYATSYESIEGNIKEWYKKSSEVINAVGNSEIVGHSYCNNVAKTVYANGVCVYVNYGLETAEVDGLNIPSEDFVLVKEGNYEKE